MHCVVVLYVKNMQAQKFIIIIINIILLYPSIPTGAVVFSDRREWLLFLRNKHHFLCFVIYILFVLRVSLLFYYLSRISRCFFLYCVVAVLLYVHHIFYLVLFVNSVAMPSTTTALTSHI